MGSITDPDGRDLAAGLTAPPGTPFLRWLVGHLATELRCRFALLWERSGETWERVHLVAGSERGEPFAPDLDLPFAGTPCERVYAETAWSCADDVQGVDPKNAFLAQLGVRSYVGLALADGAGRQLGHLMLLDDRRCADPAAWLAALQRFAARAAGQLATRRAVRELEELIAASHVAGQETIHALVRGLARALHAKTAFLCELLHGRSDRVRTLSIVVDGKLQACGEVDLDGTPCATTHRDGAHFVADQVQQLYPRDALLDGLGRRGYLGLRLDARDGTPLGHIGVLHDGPLAPALAELPILRLYADRAATELERRRDAEARELAERRLFEAQKRESLGVLAGGLAHDLNNQLMGILGHVTLARPPADGRADPEWVNHVESIEQATRRAAGVVQQMMACAGKRIVEGGALDLAALVAETARHLEATAPAGVRVELALAESLPPAHGDRAQLRQLLDALAGNAVEALAGREGAIRLATGRVALDAAARRALHLAGEFGDGDHLWIEVADDGCGMEAATLARAAEPFFTTKGEGRGLGLAIAHGLARAHRGALSLHSERGRGTVARLLLPLAAPAEPAGTAARAALRAAPPSDRGDGRERREERVLLVDDDPMVRQATKRMLERLGYRVRAEADGAAALRAFAELGATARFVLLDLTMPGMSGEECFRELRRIEPRLRVILMTGYSAPEALRRLEGAGLSAFLQKPFGLPELQRCLAATLPAESDAAQA